MPYGAQQEARGQKWLRFLRNRAMLPLQMPYVYALLGGQCLLICANCVYIRLAFARARAIETKCLLILSFIEAWTAVDVIQQNRNIIKRNIRGIVANQWRCMKDDLSIPPLKLTRIQGISILPNKLGKAN